MNLTEDRSSNEVDWNLLLPVRLTFRGFVRHRSCIAFSSFYEPVYGFFFLNAPDSANLCKDLTDRIVYRIKGLKSANQIITRYVVSFKSNEITGHM